MSLTLLFTLSLIGVILGRCNGVNELFPLGIRERIERAGCIELLVIWIIHIVIDEGVGPVLTFRSLHPELFQAPLGIDFAVDTNDPALVEDETWFSGGDVDVLEASLDANAKRLVRTASGTVVNEPRFSVAIPFEGSDKIAVVAVDAILPILGIGFEIHRGR